MPADLYGYRAFHQSRRPTTDAHADRIHVSSDGAKILSTTPLSKDCLAMTMPADTGDQKAVGLMATDLVNDAPVESQVFVSMLHAKPVWVGNRRGSWMVSGQAIHFLGEWKQKD